MLSSEDRLLSATDVDDCVSCELPREPLRHEYPSAEAYEEALARWDELQPTDERCLTQLGGLLCVRDGKVVYEYRDDGICAVCNFEELLAALEAEPEAAASSAAVEATPPTEPVPP